MNRQAFPKTVGANVTFCGECCSKIQRMYRVVQKTNTQFYFWENFRNSAPILTILSLLQAEIYGA